MNNISDYVARIFRRIKLLDNNVVPGGSVVYEEVEVLDDNERKGMAEIVAFSVLCTVFQKYEQIYLKSHFIIHRKRWW